MKNRILLIISLFALIVILTSCKPSQPTEDTDAMAKDGEAMMEKDTKDTDAMAKDGEAMMENDTS